jgi:peptidoglycan/LPS O-acetylase OafA/YrhL
MSGLGVNQPLLSYTCRRLPDHHGFAKVIFEFETKQRSILGYFRMSLPESSKEIAHVPELDGIRGVAIAMVLMFHYVYVPAIVAPGGLAWHVLAPLRIGWTGVDLFFVLSGFLIGGILLDARGSSNYFKVFYVRRFYRIVPLYVVVLGACYILTVVVERRHASQFDWMLESRLPWFSYMLYVQNFWMTSFSRFGMPGLGATWSLAVEEQFYMTLPLLVWLFDRRRLRNFLIGLVIAAPVIRTVLRFVWPVKDTLPFVMMPCRADALLLGVLAAIAMRSPSNRTWVENHGRLILGAIFVLLGGCAVSIHVSPEPTSRLMQTVGYTWMALLYSLVLVYVLTNTSSLVSRVLRGVLLRSLGRIAYGVYLLHAFVLILLSGWISPAHPIHSDWPALDSWFQLGVTFVALFLTVGLCWLSWKYFEKPLVQIGHRWKYEDDPLSCIPNAAQLSSPR